MAGVRIHHHSERNRVLRIENYGRLIRQSDGLMRPKLYHVALDDLGNAIVSETVWERIQQAGFGNEFLIMNEVARPPGQTVEIILPPKASVHTPA